MEERSPKRAYRSPQDWEALVTEYKSSGLIGRADLSHPPWEQVPASFLSFLQNLSQVRLRNHQRVLSEHPPSLAPGLDP